MKIINEKGRLFGIINPVDLIILLVIVLGIVGVTWKLFGTAVSDTISPETKMTAIVHVRGIAPEVVNGISASKPVGQKIISGNDYIDASISNVSYIPYSTQVANEHGQLVTTVDPIRKDILFTLTASVPKGTATPKIGAQEVRVGKTYDVKCLGFEIAGTVESVVIDK